MTQNYFQLFPDFRCSATTDNDQNIGLCGYGMACHGIPSVCSHSTVELADDGQDHSNIIKEWNWGYGKSLGMYADDERHHAII